MFGFLLGAGLSLLGGVLSKPRRQEDPPPPPPPPPPAPPPQVIVVEKQTNTVDMGKLVEDSKKAGFNPLTVLRNGGLAGYQVTHVPFLTTNPQFVDWEAKNKSVTDNYNWEVKKQEIQWQNDNAKRQWLGGLVSSVGGMVSNFAEKYNPTVMRQAEERRVLENDLMRSEILRNNSSVSKMFQPNVATGLSRATTVDRSGNLKYGWKDGDVTVTNPWGEDKVYPELADAEAYEARYGEILSEFSGIRNYVVDNVYSFINDVQDYSRSDVVQSGWGWFKNAVVASKSTGEAATPAWIYNPYAKKN